MRRQIAIDAEGRAVWLYKTVMGCGVWGFFRMERCWCV